MILLVYIRDNQGSQISHTEWQANQDMRPNSAQMHTVRMPRSSFSGYHKSWRIWSPTMILSVDRSFGKELCKVSG